MADAGPAGLQRLVQCCTASPPAHRPDCSWLIAGLPVPILLLPIAVALWHPILRLLHPARLRAVRTPRRIPGRALTRVAVTLLLLLRQQLLVRARWTCWLPASLRVHARRGCGCVCCVPRAIARAALAAAAAAHRPDQANESEADACGHGDNREVCDRQAEDGAFRGVAGEARLRRGAPPLCTPHNLTLASAWRKEPRRAVWCVRCSSTAHAQLQEDKGTACMNHGDACQLHRNCCVPA